VVFNLQSPETPVKARLHGALPLTKEALIVRREHQTATVPSLKVTEEWGQFI